MLKLNLGVNDIPYVDEGEGKTTGEVAEILEGKYHIMETFSEMHEEGIADALADSMAGALENIMAGAPADVNPFGEGESKIEATFKTFLDMRELDGAIDGVPTRAAMRGVNHRLKIKKGEPRPSFIDTGLYQSSFKAWVE